MNWAKNKKEFNENTFEIDVFVGAYAPFLASVIQKLNIKEEYNGLRNFFIMVTPCCAGVCLFSWAFSYVARL